MLQLLTLLATLSSTAFAASAIPYVNPGPSPFKPSPNYVGKSNGTIVNSPLVPGAQFDRFIQIFLENTDYATAASSPTFQKLALQGITLGQYYSITHPSQPNYVAVMSGDTQGQVFDDIDPKIVYPPIPDNVETIVSLLDAKNISWASYAENLPCVGYTGFDFSSVNYNTPGAADYPYYVRRHVGAALHGSIIHNPTRRNRIRNFNNFAEDVSADALPQWMFITPNIVNDAHDTTIDYASSWLEYFLVPLLADKRFNNDRTLVLLSFDESAIQNPADQIFVAALGGSIPKSSLNTTDMTCKYFLSCKRFHPANFEFMSDYTHYSTLSTIENNWGIPVGSLGTGDNSTTQANVFSWVAKASGYKGNNNLTSPPVENQVAPVKGTTGGEPGNFAVYDKPTVA